MISVGFKIEDDKIHPSYFCRIKGKTALGKDVAVTGLLSEGYNLQSASNYGQPLMDFTVGQKILAAGAVAQEVTKGMTSQTLANSIQVYENESPVTMTLLLSFIALRDPVNEVSRAERYLLEMKAPLLREGVLMSGVSTGEVASFVKDLATSGSWSEAYRKMAGKMGRRPRPASVTIAKHIMFPEVLISDVEIQDESVNHKTGVSMGKVINVTIVFQRTINNTEFAKLFPY